MNNDLASSTLHAHALRNFILDFNLTVCIDAPVSEVAYTYVSPNGFSYRTYNFYSHSYNGTEGVGMFYYKQFVSHHVPLTIRLNMDDMFERNYCHIVILSQASLALSQY